MVTYDNSENDWGDNEDDYFQHNEENNHAECKENIINSENFILLKRKEINKIIKKLL